LNLTQESFEKLYRYEQDLKTKERMLLIFIVVYQRKASAVQIARDLHRSKSWTCVWLKRYDKEGIEGLKNRPKSGRPIELSEDIEYQFKQELKQNKQGWRITKQVDDLIIKKSGIKYHYILTYAVVFF
jgi:putative transposase